MAEIYNTSRFAELYYGAQKPTSEHLLLAAKYIASVCQLNSIPYAFMGGWSIRLRGSDRYTHDVDVAVSTAMENFKQAVTKYPRLCFPAQHGSAAVNIFVHTGASFDGERYKHLPDLAVQVDVIMSGNMGIPAVINDTTSELFPIANDFSARLIIPYYLLEGKFDAFMNRGQSDTKDFQDLVFLIARYSNDVRQRSPHLKKAHREAFLEKLKTLHAGNTPYIKAAGEILGLVEQQPSQSQESAAEWTWDPTYQRYKRLVNGQWQWAPGS